MAGTSLTKSLARSIAKSVVMADGASSVSGPTSPPVNTEAPVVSGPTFVGQSLSCTTGQWSNLPDSYSYQWTRDGVDIGSATASTYTLVDADIAADIGCEVVATNAGGSSDFELSNEVGPILKVSGWTTSTATIDGTDYMIHTLASGSANLVVQGGTLGDVEVFRLAGGGGLRLQTFSYGWGGGGGGGLLHNIGSPITLAAGTYPGVVGEGGVANSTASLAVGGNTTFNGLSAIGGGTGTASAGIAGGSGGGAGGASATGGTATAGQGNAGGAGDGTILANRPGGGGGGAGAVGSSATSTAAGNGGAGVELNFFGTLTYYGGGGGGGIRNGTGGTGGLGGGGSGTSANGTNGTDGLGGGAGGGKDTVTAGNGGRGILGVRHPF